MTSQGEVLIRVLLAIGAVLVVPLALPLLGASSPARPLDRWVARLLQVGSFAFAAAMLIGSGPLALALAVPWTVAAATHLALRLDALRTQRTFERLVATLAAFWLAAGALMACFAVNGTDAPATAEHLRWPTPAHFIYAGFALTTIALTARRARRRTGTLVALVAVLAGMPLLAIEIGFFSSTQWTGAIFIGTAAIALAIEQTIIATTTNCGSAQAGLYASSAALAAAMVLAIGYGLSMRFGFAWLSLEAMAATHGALNSLGFALLSVIGWRLRASEPQGIEQLDTTGSVPT
jgi:hypothetical protein